MRISFKKATELIVSEILKRRKFYSIRSDEKDEIWMYDEGIYVPNGRSYILEFCRVILEHAFTTNFANTVAEKVMADSFIDADKFFSSESLEWLPIQ
ncbi:MAG: hypothetical protein EOM23_05110, partial [Candidatus Moranbacteria bacterium]|nr:hypothetical protein [Candidatus Moranbacteria bacterium]